MTRGLSIYVTTENHSLKAFIHSAVGVGMKSQLKGIEHVRKENKGGNVLLHLASHGIGVLAGDRHSDETVVDQNLRGKAIV